jgi:uncharacterized protein CbrC (UPF0167 family)
MPATRCFGLTINRSGWESFWIENMKNVAHFFSDWVNLPTLETAVHRSENHCSTCGTARRIVYSGPVARGYELQSLFCSNCKTTVRTVRNRPSEAPKSS